MRIVLLVLLAALAVSIGLAARCLRSRSQPPRAAAPAGAGGGEASLVLPDLSTVDFRGINGRTLLMGGLVVCALGLLFGLMTFTQLKNLPVHASMLRGLRADLRDVQDLSRSRRASSSCILWVFIAVDHLGRTTVARRRCRGQVYPVSRVAVILLFSLIGIAGSYGVAWFGIRVNTFANSRAAFASLRGKPFPIYAIPLRAGMSIGMLLISVELLLMLCILLFIPGDYAGAVLHRLRHRRVARRGGAAHRRRHLHEDRRHRLGPDEDRLQHQGRRRAQPGRDRRLHRRQRRRLGRAERRRVRDLRRDGRRADLVHPARRPRRSACRCSCSSGSS